VQLDELLAERLDVVERVRSARMPGDLRLLPAVERLVDLARRPLELGLELRDLLGATAAGWIRLQLGDAAAEI